MQRYMARDLLALTPDELWALPEERHIVVFDDGELETHTRATITSVYLWWPIANRNDVPLLKDYHLQDERFTSKRMLKKINKVIWAIHTTEQETTDTEWLARVAFDTVNRFYNDFTIRLSSYVATLSMFDLIEVMEHPTIKAANDNVEPTQHSIENICYPAIRGVFDDPEQLKGNPLKEATLSGTLKFDQVVQCIGPPGFKTDINSDIFPFPITKGYLEGIDQLYGAMTESRSGSKSLLYNKELLRNTEYFNRKTQLIAQYVQRLQPGDCGTPHLVDFPVTEGSLGKLTGKYYLTQNGTLDHIRGNETHLEGTTIKIRSVLGCIHPDPAGICSVCYGRLAFSIPKGTNIGQVSAVSIGDKITSSVLSTKHSESSSRVERLELKPKEKKYIRYGKEPETLYLKKEYHNVKKWITVVREEVKSLADVLMLPNLDAYPPANASELTRVLITTDLGKEGTESEVLDVSLYNRKSSFSRELLEHIRRVRWVHDTSGNVVIDISGFDVEQPFLTLPFKHVNMAEVMKRIQSFLHSGTDQGPKKLGNADRVRKGKRNYLKSYQDPAEALVVFYNMLNEKISANIVHCETLVYAMMVRSSSDRDYRLPIPGLRGSFEKYNTLMLNRSLAAAMAFEKQDQPLVSPASFIYSQRNDHPYDLLLMGGHLS